MTTQIVFNPEDNLGMETNAKPILPTQSQRNSCTHNSCLGNSSANISSIQEKLSLIIIPNFVYCYQLNGEIYFDSIESCSVTLL